MEIFQSIDSLSNNQINQTSCEIFIEAGVHMILNIIKAQFFFRFHGEY